jgi:osmotically inducible protein OsmC
MQRTSSAVWQGGLRDGNGTVTTGSGALSAAPYSFASRFERGGQTDPEELIAAAHAGCFSMALSGQLGQANLKADRIATTAAVTLEKTDSGFTVTAVHLTVRAKVPGATKDAFDKAANNAKAGCPISRLLNTNITMDAAME